MGFSCCWLQNKKHSTLSMRPEMSSGDSGANAKRLEQETDAKIQLLKCQSAGISPDVVQRLLKCVATVKN